MLDRPGAPAGRLPPELREALDDSRVHRIDNTPVAASSTEVRRRLASRCDDLYQLVPPLVLDYIVKYDLYR